MKLNFKQKISFWNHLLKVLRKDHHQEMQALLSKYINQNSVVFDVGGHAGQFTKLFSRMANQGQVYVFEPSIYSRSILQVMIGLKYLKNVYFLPFGLSDKKERAVINTPIKKQGSLGYGLAFVGDASQYDRETLKSEILLTTIDEIVDCLPLERLDFIKADIEGSEFMMLKGAKKTLEKYKPKIFIEINRQALERNQHTPEMIFDFLQKLQYEKIKYVKVEEGIEEIFDTNNALIKEGDYIFE